MRKQAGFTLTELIVVMIIVAILASIAIPSYRQAVIKGNRRAAQAVMMDIANRERQYFIANRQFGSATDLGYALPQEVVDNYSYTITVAAGPPPGFTINFTAIGAQVSDGNLSLTSAGDKSPADKW